MISYETYKLIHLISLFLFFTAFTTQLFSEPKKLFKILSGVATLLILVSGMGLLARVGVRHSEPWPVWAIIKMVIWLILALGLPVVIKRFPRWKSASYWGMLLFFSLAAWTILFR